LIQERDQKEAELVTLLKLTPIDIWNNDLEHFLIEWQVSFMPQEFPEGSG